MSGKWLLDIFKVSQLKSGELREVKPMYSLAEMLMRQPGYLSELDLRVARLLVAMHSHHAYYSGYPLEGSSGAELLEMLLRTSRLFLDFEDLQPLVSGCEDASASSPGPSRPTAVSVAQWSSAEAAQRNRAGAGALYYLDREQRQIGPLFNELEEKLASHLTLAPDIPARQAMQFSHRMSAATRIPPPHQLTERIIDDVLPQPQLTLVSGGALALEYDLEHRAALVFTYNGQPTVDRNPEVMILQRHRNPAHSTPACGGKETAPDPAKARLQKSHAQELAGSSRRDVHFGG